MNFLPENSKYLFKRYIWSDFRILQLKCSQNAVKIQSKCSQNSIKMQPNFIQNSVKIHSKRLYEKIFNIQTHKLQKKYLGKIFFLQTWWKANVLCWCFLVWLWFRMLWRFWRSSFGKIFCLFHSVIKTVCLFHRII